MLSILPILLLLSTPLVMAVVHKVRPRFAFQWLIATTAALLAWVMTLLTYLTLPQKIQLLPWLPAEISPEIPMLLLDQTSWFFELALSTLILAIILTAVSRLRQVDWRAWASTLVLGGLGIAAVLSGNLLTMLLVLAALDLAELFILLMQAALDEPSEQIVVAFSARAAGLFVLLLAGILSWSEGMGGDFASFTPLASIYVFLGAGLRLGVIPPHLPYLRELALRRGLGTSLRLVSAAGSLLLLTRASTSNLPDAALMIFSVLACLAALLGAILWASSRDEIAGRPYWILGIASLALAAAAGGQQLACLAWGVSGLLSGGLLFLYAPRHRNLLPLVSLGLLGMTALPFVPSWNGLQLYLSPGFYLYSPVSIAIFIGFIGAQSLLLFGYLRHMLHPVEGYEPAERWVWLIYPVGLAVIPGAQYLIGWLEIVDLANTPLLMWLGGLPATGLAALLWLGSRENQLFTRIVPYLQQNEPRWRGLLGFSWVYYVLGRIFQLLTRLSEILSNILEGEGGILWALVLLVLLFTVLVR